LQGCKAPPRERKRELLLLVSPRSEDLANWMPVCLLTVQPLPLHMHAGRLAIYQIHKFIEGPHWVSRIHGLCM
jgi:hypothetical protein